MLIYVNDDTFYFEAMTFLKAYYPDEVMEQINDDTLIHDYGIYITENAMWVKYYENGKLKTQSDFCEAELEPDNRIEDPLHKRKELKKRLKSLIYDVNEKGFHKTQPWGILTGIRPTKVVFQLLEEYGNEVLVRERLEKEYRIFPSKVDLMMQVAKKELAIVNANQQNELSLYIGIPFCPTKCLYCSFTSYSIEKYQHLVKVYLQALDRELSFLTHDTIMAKKIRSIYIGGGTPTSLDLEGLTFLMEILGKYISIPTVDEFTVEAGRPDTITLEKLRVLKKAGVHRISINPQTMNQKTLDVIGRRHTSEEIIKVYELARAVGIKAINMDLILGLPGENPQDVEETIRRIEALGPDNVTVHTMAIKRGSNLIEHQKEYQLLTTEDIERMLLIVSEGMKRMGFEPYYLYRQKHMLGNFENVGYAKPGFECIYNVEIMEERETILAFGAGAITKWVSEDCKHIDRIENVKNVEEYIRRVEEMLLRKTTFFAGLS